MKTALIADIHGNDVAFEAVEIDMKTRGVNNVIFLGDLVAVGPQPQEVYDRLMGLNKLCLIKGNTDAWLDDAMIDIIPSGEKEVKLLAYYDYMAHNMTVEAMDKLIGLEKESLVHMGHYLILCVHGSRRGIDDAIVKDNPNDILDAQLERVTASVVFSGHSHVYHDFNYHAHRLINPGSISLSGNGKASYVIVDSTAGFHVEHIEVDYDYNEVLNIAKKRNLPNFEDFRQRLIGDLN